MNKLLLFALSAVAALAQQMSHMKFKLHLQMEHDLVMNNLRPILKIRILFLNSVFHRTDSISGKILTYLSGHFLPL